MSIEKFIEIENVCLIRVADAWKGWSRKQDENSLNTLSNLANILRTELIVDEKINSKRSN